MRIQKVAATAVALSMLLGASAFAAERTTRSATLVNPVTQAYVATFVQDCSGTSRYGDVYLGVYLAQPFQVQGKNFLSLQATIISKVPPNKGIAFRTSPRAIGEEGWVSEIGGESSMGCLPIGTHLFLLNNRGMATPPQVLAEGTIK